VPVTGALLAALVGTKLVLRHPVGTAKAGHYDRT